jgi:hypothetical protein
MQMSDDLSKEVIKAMNLISECMHLNKISRSAGICAMINHIISAVSHAGDRKTFSDLIDYMRISYDEEMKDR